MRMKRVYLANQKGDTPVRAAEELMVDPAEDWQQVPDGKK
jgi:hypothetical protein